MLFKWLFGPSKRKQIETTLLNLLDSFAGSFGTPCINALTDDVRKREFHVALEAINHNIYDLDVLVTPEQEAALFEVADYYRFSRDRFDFIGRTPPYPDLRSPDMIEADERAVDFRRRARQYCYCVSNKSPLGSEPNCSHCWFSLRKRKALSRMMGAMACRAYHIA